MSKYADNNLNVEHDCITREHDPMEWCPDCFPITKSEKPLVPSGLKYPERRPFKEERKMNETETCKICFALILFEYRSEHESWHRKEEIEPEEIRRLVTDGLRASSLLKLR